MALDLSSVGDLALPALLALLAISAFVALLAMQGEKTKKSSRGTRPEPTVQASGEAVRRSTR
jgi:hypothetical protein